MNPLGFKSITGKQMITYLPTLALIKPPDEYKYEVRTVANNYDTLLSMHTTHN